MKEKYEIPNMEVLYFESEDVITTSLAPNELEDIDLANP